MSAKGNVQTAGVEEEGKGNTKDRIQKRAAQLLYVAREEIVETRHLFSELRTPLGPAYRIIRHVTCTVDTYVTWLIAT